MILDELVVHNFGVYSGRQSAVLTPEEGRPITLFGGLNGGGKTTLLDALQLCLFGPSARCSNRHGLGYEEFLRRSVHRGADVPEAAIELEFRHTAEGAEQSWRLHRSWRSGSGSARERFEVLRNGSPDALATEHWAELVEDLIPARIAHLFLFDGEKVESYADLDEAPTLIATAIQNLLGLDIVERLSADLIVLERRKRHDRATPSDRTRWEDARRAVETLEAARDGLIGRQGQTKVELDGARGELIRIEERFQRDGGVLFERRGLLETQVQSLEIELQQVRKELLELAGGTLPILLVRSLFDAVSLRDESEESTRRLRDSVAAVDEEHGWLLGQPELLALDGEARAELSSRIRRRQEERRRAATAPILLDLAVEARSSLAALRGHELPDSYRRAQAAVSREQKIVATLEQARDSLAAVPSQDVIADLLVCRAQAQAKVASLEAEHEHIVVEIGRLGREIDQAREREARLAERDVRQTFDEDDLRRILSHSSKVRSTLGRFREAVVRRHVSRIQALVLESFLQLVHKSSLVVRLEIDPETFDLRLFGSDGHQVTPDRLSAGERQLLAIAILWGLGRSSGRPLPTVIDTPLGRLDSIHRTHLVRRYFPKASHQVLLLSTDEEITGPYLKALEPAINRTYELRFDKAKGSSAIEPGYLPIGGKLGH